MANENEEKPEEESSGNLSGSAESLQDDEIPTPALNNGIPNGGLVAWLQVLGSFFMFMNSWGIVNTFGVYQTYYTQHLSESPSNISWIGSIQAYLLLLVGSATGPLYDAGYFRSLLITGSFLVVFGMMMTSICTEYWQIMLAQALTVGIGCGCLFVPSVAVVSTYFSTKKAFATGIAASGSSLGGVLYPIIFRRLQPTLGFGWATRILAFIALFGCIISLSVMRLRVLPPQKRSLWDLSAFRDKPFLFFCAGMFFGFMGLYIPFFYIQSYAIAKKITSEDFAFYLLSILNAASIFGRIIPNFIADRTGPFNVLIPATIATCVLGFSWMGIHSTAGLIVFSLLYGFFSGSFVSIPPTVLVTLSPHLGVLGTRMGMNFALSGLGLLAGTPVAGQLVKNYGYDAAIAYCGACVGLAIVCFVFARGVKSGWKLKVVS